MLNILNRIVTILALLLVIGLALAIAIGIYVPALPDQLLTLMRNWFSRIEGLNTTQQLIWTLIAATVAVVAFLMLVVELRPGKSNTSVRIKNEDGTVTTVEREAISQRVQYAVDMLDDVIGVSPEISGSGNGLNVTLDVVTTPVVDIPMKSAEIRETTRQVIEEQMGLTLKKLTLKVAHSQLPATPGREGI